MKSLPTSAHSLPSLSEQLRSGLGRRVSWAIITIGLISTGLQLGWAVFQKSMLEKRISDAIAHTLQEPVRKSDWIAIKRTVNAFQFANPSAHICVQLSDNIIVEPNACLKPKFTIFPVNLTDSTFGVSVKIPVLNSMSLATTPFLLTALLLIVLISRYLQSLTKKITSDLYSLASFGNDAQLNFRELAEAQNQIAEGIALRAKQSEMRVEAALGALAAQTAHDIRSPLAALDFIVRDLNQLPEEKRVLVRSAVTRINDIANNLLQHRRSGLGHTTFGDKLSGINLSSTCLLTTLIDSIVTEKRCQLRNSHQIDIQHRWNSSAYGVFVSVNISDFKRVISNIITNGVEAIEGTGVVFIDSSLEAGKVNIIIQDNGKGMPAEVLQNAMSRPLTIGKEAGNGLGLVHAKTSVESWNGKISIQSELGTGTRVSIVLPIARSPDWFAPNILTSSCSTIVVLDDDQSIHEVWRERFNQNYSSKVTVKHFSTSSEFKRFLRSLNGNLQDFVFLVDFELIGCDETGLDLIESFGIAASSLLVTSRFEETSIVNRCETLGIKMIPKSMAGFVPIVSAETSIRTASAFTGCIDF